MNPQSSPVKTKCPHIFTYYCIYIYYYYSVCSNSSRQPQKKGRHSIGQSLSTITNRRNRNPVSKRKETGKEKDDDGHQYGVGSRIVGGGMLLVCSAGGPIIRFGSCVFFFFFFPRLESWDKTSDDTRTTTEKTHKKKKEQKILSTTTTDVLEMIKLATDSWQLLLWVFLR